MKRSILSLFILTATSYAQLGWEPYTGQPTQTMYGGVAGAALGYMLAPAISKGPDAQWIGALTGLAAGGLLGNYMAGDNNTHQQLVNNQGQSSTKTAPRVEQGIKVNQNVVQSPYSDYVVNAKEFQPGSIVADPITGGLFRIPR